jgi:hypothetical protein
MGPTCFCRAFSISVFLDGVGTGVPTFNSSGELIAAASISIGMAAVGVALSRIDAPAASPVIMSLPLVLADEKMKAAFALRGLKADTMC